MVIVLFLTSAFIVSPTVSYDTQHAYLQNLFDGAGLILAMFGIILVVFSIRAKKNKTDASQK